MEIIYNKLLKQVNDEKQIINNKINQIKNENKKNDLNNEFKKAKNANDIKNLLSNIEKELILQNANNLKTEKIALKALLEGITDQNTRDSLSDEIDKANTKEMIENIKSKIQSIIIKNKQDLFEFEKNI
ncbi:hypothetical protein [Mycoplasmopsis cynos]|uniref:hypothetical protein n=1 Tax=Mycoplasmopsis cynos TaxID=171284 RepID=UPI0024C86EFC|nr:hypothetical protein [Mycoplasmopsis cynos]WAM09034.1 hypothetical protein ONA03_01500 [Mycoplasmopsis cynos]